MTPPTRKRVVCLGMPAACISGLKLAPALAWAVLLAGCTTAPPASLRADVVTVGRVTASEPVEVFFPSWDLATYKLIYTFRSDSEPDTPIRFIGNPGICPRDNAGDQAYLVFLNHAQYAGERKTVRLLELVACVPVDAKTSIGLRKNAQ